MQSRNETLNFSLEIKGLSEREFEGHGSIFGNVDEGNDIVVPGAFKRSLAQHRKSGTVPQMFWMHQPDKVPGMWSEVQEDEKGLYVQGTLADTALGNEMHTLLNMKAVRGLSIGYQVIDRDFDEDGHRILKEIDLWEVSLVSLAMNPLAKVEAVKSRLSRDGVYVPTAREFETVLRDAGVANSAAKAIVSFLYSKSAGMVDGFRRDDGDAESAEAAELLKSLDRSTQLMIEDVFR